MHSAGLDNTIAVCLAICTSWYGAPREDHKCLPLSGFDGASDPTPQNYPDLDNVRTAVAEVITNVQVMLRKSGRAAQAFHLVSRRVIRGFESGRDLLRSPLTVVVAVGPCCEDLRGPRGLAPARRTWDRIGQRDPSSQPSWCSAPKQRVRESRDFR